MAGVLDSPGVRAGVTFELDDFGLEDGHVVVSGQWHGVRGMRFVRPALVVGGRQVLATLEHKPWAPDADPWIAAFPWKDGPIDAAGVLLAVAPSVTVALVPGTEPVAPEEPPEPAAEPAPAPDDARLRALEARVDALQAEVDALTRQRDALRAQRDEAQALATAHEERVGQLQDAIGRERQLARTASEGHDEVHRARAAAERERDQALAQRQEAVEDREAAIRTRRRMEGQLEEALQARDEAEGHCDEVRAQRDEALIATEALRRHAIARPAAASAAPRDDDEVPIGVHTIPAARIVAADLHRGLAGRGHDTSAFDVWAIRVLGSIAAVCFILLLVMLLRIFL